MTMRNPKPETPQTLAHAARTLRAAFTLMELMVSIAIMVVIILAVGMTFSGTSKAVGMSQAVMEEMAGMRETQRLIERDLQGLDRNGFLVIRSRLNDTTQGDRSLRFDQISFLETGTFPNRSGANTTSPFTDSSVANAAHVWIGQGVLESANPPDGSFMGPSQGTLPGSWQSRLPSGVAGEYRATLMLHRTLLFPGPAVGGVIKPAGNPVMAYGSAELGAANVAGLDGSAHITSSRWSIAAVTPGQIMQTIATERQNGVSNMPEYDFYTYRFRALDSVYDTEVGTNPFVNGYFRTTPILMRGVTSFRVEWTDGAIDGTNQLKWYGPLLSSGGAGEAYCNSTTPNANGDHYVAIFSYFNRPYWPKALRISMHVANDRIGGRDFTQIVNLP